MWVLSCEGDLFEGKRLWLRPGTSHLFGRTTSAPENGERVQSINNKNVSRKHLTITVSESSASDVSRLHAKSEIRLQDSSKSGTTVDGEKFKQDEKLLYGSVERRAEHTIRLGSYEHLLHLVWQPVVIALTTAGKSRRELALAEQQAKFEGTDIRVFADYLVNTSTHCVSKKRNTPSVLQALLQAKWVVTDDYLTTLANTVQRGASTAGNGLESDFDSNWPKEEDYIIPPGTEPSPRPNEFYMPNPERAEVFHNFTFVFLSQSQLDSLLPVITAGGGKALAREVDLATDEVDDVLDYIREVAGQKQSKNFRLSQQPSKGGIVVVRAGQRDERYREFMRSIDSALDQRSIEQNELLDPILTLDTSGLRRQLPEESQASAVESQSRPQCQTPVPAQRDTRPASASNSHDDVRQDQPNLTSETKVQTRNETTSASLPADGNDQNDNAKSHAGPSAVEEAVLPKKRARRVITQSRFKGFDDFDPSQFSKPASQSPERSSNQQQSVQSQSAQDMDIEEPSQVPQIQQSSRKRPAPSQEEPGDDEDIYANILTATNAMKRRKLAFEKNVDPSTVQTETDRRLAEKAARAKKKAKELDVMAEIQVRRKREEEEFRKNEESLREALNGVDITEIRKLVKIEEMEVPVRDRPARRSAHGLPNERWNDAWNGRTNFKRFCRQGERNANVPRVPRVMITLEEVPRKGHGIGEEYWLTSTSTKKNKPKNQTQTPSQLSRETQQSATTLVDEDNTDSARFRRRLQYSREQDHENDALGDILPDEIAGHARDEHLEAVANANATGGVNPTPSQTLGTKTQRRAAGKRRAEEQASPAVAKKARPSRQVASTNEVVTIDDDDDDDGLKFRRRRK